MEEIRDQEPVLEPSNEEASSTETADVLKPLNSETIMENEYKPIALRKPQCIADMGREVLGLQHVYGYDSSRRGNLFLIEDDRIVFVSGNTVVFESTTDGSREFLPGISEGGVGCVAVHPTRY